MYPKKYVELYKCVLRRSCSVLVMEAIRALVANEPTTYRDVLVDALRTTRPQLEVITVEPEELKQAVEQFNPHLVVCSQPSTTLSSGSFMLVTLYPGGKNQVEIHVPEKHVTLAGIGFDDLLSIVDSTELFFRSE